nr:DNA helicase [Tanacetum cinerariifolium]
MADDIPAKVSEQIGIPNYHVNTTELQGYILYQIVALLNGCGMSVIDFGLHTPQAHLLEDLKTNCLWKRGNYNRDLLRLDTLQAVPKLNTKQRKIYDLIMNATSNNTQELIFVYGHGGTRKTFLWMTIISSLWSKRKFVLAVTSSGIASLLLPAGRTAHSQFKLPLELTNE